MISVGHFPDQHLTCNVSEADIFCENMSYNITKEVARTDNPASAAAAEVSAELVDEAMEQATTSDPVEVKSLDELAKDIMRPQHSAVLRCGVDRL